MRFHKFFDETKSTWIDAYKKLTVVFFFIFVLCGIVISVWDFIEESLLVDVFTPVPGFIMWNTIGFGAGYGQLIINMNIIQLLTNISEIRQALDSAGKSNSENSNCIK